MRALVALSSVVNGLNSIIEGTLNCLFRIIGGGGSLSFVFVLLVNDSSGLWFLILRLRLSLGLKLIYVTVKFVEFLWAWFATSVEWRGCRGWYC